LDITLCAPRGFCAGVDRAIQIVELALERYGAPVYVRHAIVHNKYVVDGLKQKGAVFVEELDEVPEGKIAIFSAHGVSKTVEMDAESRHLQVIDATCPLVSKVHVEGRRYASQDREVILIGHAGHPEVEGTMGQVPGGVQLISNAGEVDKLTVKDPNKLAYVTQTTLSVDDTREVIEALKRRFPAIVGPDTKDICYATQNRQRAVRQLSEQVDMILVIGAPNSSNSNRLREIAEELGVRSHLIENAGQLDPKWLDGVQSVGVTAGASAPDVLVQEVVAKLRDLKQISLSVMEGIAENVKFRLPPQLEAQAQPLAAK
jgi:4-hydroxy-3-methylbut-2-enyl diphosphate reductase